MPASTPAPGRRAITAIRLPEPNPFEVVQFPPAERAVLEYWVIGTPHRTIAQALGITVKTVENHLHNATGRVAQRVNHGVRPSRQALLIYYGALCARRFQGQRLAAAP